MASDQIRYDLLTQQALRSMVRDLLADVAKKGLPGEHHFFITFDTLAEGVKLSQRMRAQYPREMTIVLQHQFWDLAVFEDRFEVGLSFNGIPERLAIPLTAIKGFFDPSVQFGLQFEDQVADDDDAAARPEPAKLEPAKPEAARPEPSKPEPSKPEVARLDKLPQVAAPSKTGGPPEGPPDDGPRNPDGGGQVVRLDRFRKK
jgi:hypothetical protein